MEAGAVIVRRLSLKAAFFMVNQNTRAFMKNKIGNKCNLQSLCGDLPGFCLWLPLAAVGLIVVMIIYFISTSQL